LLALRNPGEGNLERGGIGTALDLRLPMTKVSAYSLTVDFTFSALEELSRSRGNFEIFDTGLLPLPLRIRESSRLMTS
jgi:hypothetical protein